MLRLCDYESVNLTSNDGRIVRAETRADAEFIADDSIAQASALKLAHAAIRRLVDEAVDGQYHRDGKCKCAPGACWVDQALSPPSSPLPLRDAEPTMTDAGYKTVGLPATRPENWKGPEA